MFLQRIREFFAARRQMRVMVNLIDVWKTNRPLTPLWNVEKFADEGYRRNSLIFACVTLKATSFAGPELLGFRENPEGEETELEPGHMLSLLLARPNARQSQSAFMRTLKTHLDVAGNAYILKERAGSGMPVSLRLLRPDLVRPIVNPVGDIVAYSYGTMPDTGAYDTRTLELGREDRSGNTQIIPATEIIHEQAAPDPLDPFVGISPIAVLARMGDLDNYAADYLRAFFLNAGVPAGLLKFKTQVPTEEKERIQEQWRQRYGLRAYDQTGTGGAFNIGVMDGDAEYQEIGSQVRMMNLDQIFGETESRICGAFGVHPILVASWIGLMRSTMANYEQARRSLYQDTLLPDWISVSDRLTVDLASEFGDGIVLRFALDDVTELQKDKTPEKELAVKAWDSGLITKNEGRAIWDLPPDGEGDSYKVQMGASIEPALLESYAIDVLPDARRLSERLLLSGSEPEEMQAAGSTVEWKQLHKIADAAAPRLKKKYLRPS